MRRLTCLVFVCAVGSVGCGSSSETGTGGTAGNGGNGGITVAADAQEYDGRTLVCGVWAQSRQQSEAQLKRLDDQRNERSRLVEEKLAVASQEHDGAGEQQELSKAGERDESAGDGQWIAGSLNPTLASATSFLS